MRNVSNHRIAGPNHCLIGVHTSRLRAAEVTSRTATLRLSLQNELVDWSGVESLLDDASYSLSQQVG